MENKIPSIQEMFDLAYRGMRDQEFNQCVDDDGNCVYYDSENGRRCAWGHVDPEGTLDYVAVVKVLHDTGFGLAGRISGKELTFAIELQATHDEPDIVGGMQVGLRMLARRYNLSVPDEGDNDNEL